MAQNCLSAAGAQAKVLEIQTSSIDEKEKIKLYQQIISLPKGCVELPDSVKGLVAHRIGWSYYLLDNREAAIKFTQQAIQIKTNQRPKNEIDLAKSYYNLGLIEVDNNIKNSKIALEKAVELFPKTPNWILSSAEMQLADIFTKTGEYENALLVNTNALIFASDVSDTCRTIFSLGFIYENKGEYKIALNYYLNAQDILKKNPNALNEKNSAILLNNIGNCYNLIKNYPKAQNYYSVALDMFKKINFPKNITITENNILNLKIKQGKYDFTQLREFIEKRITKEKVPSLKAKYFENLGDLFSDRKRFDEALAFYLKANVLIPTNMYQDKLSNYLDIISILPKTSSKNNLNYYLQADVLIDQMRNEHTEQGSKLFWREKTHSFYEQAIETCFQLKNYEKAFYFIEKSRAILLLDALKSIDARQVLSSAQQQQEQDLRYMLIGLQNKLSSLDEQAKEYTETLNKVIATQEKYQQFIKEIEKTNPSYFQLKYGAAYLSLNELQTKLKSTNQAFIAFFSGEKSTYILFISPTTVRWKQLPTTEISTDIQTYLSLVSKDLSTAEWKQFQAISFRLYQQFFAPFAIQQKRVIVSADNFSIPFEALLTNANGSKNDFLLHRHAFSYAYSANVHFKTLPQRFSITDKLLGVAPVSYNPKLKVSPLKGADASLSQIENEYFGGEKLIEKEATKSNFLSKLPDYQIIQLFTHGTSLGENQQPTIYFNDEVLVLNELYGLQQISAKMVVLSACETGIGKTANGEGIQSIARGFSFLGVPSLVSTLWSVDNKATYQLTEQFYGYLAKGKPKDEALQLAKIDYLNQTSNFTPYYWAGMVLVGSEKPIPNRPMYAIIGGGFISIMVLFFLYRYLKRKDKLK